MLSRLMLNLIESSFTSLYETSLTLDFPFFSLVQELMKDRHKKLSNLVVQFTSIVNEDELPGEILVLESVQDTAMTLDIYFAVNRFFVFSFMLYSTEEIPEKIELSTIDDPLTPVSDLIVKELNEKNVKTEVKETKKITKRTQSRGTHNIAIL